MSVSFTLSHAGLEVYTTTNNPQISLSNLGESNSNFNLLNGDITQIDYVGELYSDNFEQDYSDISSNATIVLPMDYYSTLYKGKKTALKKGSGVDNWSDMDTAVLGFITELNYAKDNITVKINGMDKLLEQEKKFTFKKTKMSKIITKIITESGLKAKVDTSGLTDHVINFTNVSSSGSESSSNSDGIGIEDIDATAKKIIGNETDEKKKLDKIHAWGQKEVKYDGYECSRQDNDPSKCLKNRKHLNCGDISILMCALYKSAGLTAWIIRGDYHFWVIVEIGKTKYASDCSGNHELNQVWSTSSHPNTPFKGTKVSGFKICS